MMMLMFLQPCSNFVDLSCLFVASLFACFDLNMAPEVMMMLSPF